MPIRHRRSAKRERGTALFATVLVLVLGVVGAGLTLFAPTPAATPITDRTGDALGAVRQALIGYAAQRGLPTACSNSLAQCATTLQARPGELPCPDINDDGVAEVSCANNRIGRVPWKTLGIPEPKDYAGETLWYAVSPNFLGLPSNPITVRSGYVEKGAINSNTVGTLEVRGSDGSVSTTTAAAVIFSPGVALGSQSRSRRQEDERPCAQGETADFRHLCRLNYLESTQGVNNGATAGPYIAGLASPTFNDRLIYLSASDIMPVVEMRVGTELKNLLLAYRDGAKCRCFPWADSWEYSGGIADISVNRGRFPAFDVQPVDWGVNNSENKIPPLPSWVTLNDWHNMVFYSVARSASDQAGKYCFFCSSKQTLTVLFDDKPGSGSDSASALLITPGLPRNGRSANASAYTLKYGSHTAANDMRGYFEDRLNYNKYSPSAAGAPKCAGWNAENAGGLPDPSDRPASVPTECDTYVRPTSRGYDRDRLFTITQCSADAYALLKAAPCKDNTDETKVSAVCAALIVSLQTCSMCRDAATAMGEVPCRNTLHSANCVAPISQLKMCMR